MKVRHGLLAVPMVLSITASLAQGAFVQVRDAVGGEDPDGLPEGYYRSGLGSRLSGTADGSVFHNLNSGAFDYEANFGSGFVALDTYCIEPLAGTAFGLNPPDSVGATFSTGTLTSSGLSAQEANYLQILWSNAFADSLTSKAKSAAFQSIIWEFAQDNSINLTSGMHALNNGDAYTASVRTIAQDWLDNITDGTWESSVQLITLTNPDFQDYVTVAIPAPGALALVAVAGGVMLTGRRRRAA